MSVLDKLTEGIVDRDLSKEGAALMNQSGNALDFLKVLIMIVPVIAWLV